MVFFFFFFETHFIKISFILIKYLGATLNFTLKSSAYLPPLPPFCTAHSLGHGILKFFHLLDTVYFFSSLSSAGWHAVANKMRQKQWCVTSKPEPEEALHTSTWLLSLLPSPWDEVACGPRRRGYMEQRRRDMWAEATQPSPISWAHSIPDNLQAMHRPMS